MTHIIKEKMISFDFSEAEAIEIVKALKYYVLNCGRNWKHELSGDFCRAWYGWATADQAPLLQRVRNHDEAYAFVMKLSAPKIKAESIF